jgi:hypothetical protein
MDAVRARRGVPEHLPLTRAAASDLNLHRSNTRFGWLTCAVADRLDMVMIDSAGAAQHRLPTDLPTTRPDRRDGSRLPCRTALSLSQRGKTLARWSWVRRHPCSSHRPKWMNDWSYRYPGRLTGSSAANYPPPPDPGHGIEPGDPGPRSTTAAPGGGNKSRPGTLTSPGGRAADRHWPRPACRVPGNWAGQAQYGQGRFGRAANQHRSH